MAGRWMMSIRQVMWLSLAVATIVGGCGLPGVLDGHVAGSNLRAILPDALTLAVDEFPDDATDPDAGPAEGAGRIFQDTDERSCLAIGAILHGFQRLLDRGLALSRAVNSDLQDPADPHLEATMIVDGQQITYKADFSPFDIDGDGTSDGSGRFDTEPVAVRMWVLKQSGAEQFLCALIITRPSAQNVGAGQMYMQPGVISSSVSPEFRIFASWDRTDPQSRWNEAYTLGTLRGNLQADSGHHRVEIIMLDDGSEQKTLSSVTNINASDYGFSALRFVGRTIVGSGVALVSVEGVGQPGIAVTDQCISVPGCEPAQDDSCGSIDTDGFDFLSPPTGSETDWPADYPAQPTF